MARGVSEAVQNENAAVPGCAFLASGIIAGAVFVDQADESLGEGSHRVVVEVELESGQLGDGIVSRFDEFLAERGEHGQLPLVVLGGSLEAEVPRQAGRPVRLLVRAAAALSDGDRFDQAGVHEQPEMVQDRGRIAFESVGEFLVRPLAVVAQAQDPQAQRARDRFDLRRRGLPSIDHRRRRYRPLETITIDWKTLQQPATVTSVEPVGTSDDNRLGRSFWTLVTSSGLSNLADGVFKLALPLLAIHYTRSPALVAGLELVRSFPWLVGSLPVGALIDRLDRRSTMVWANAARAAFVAVPAIAITINGDSLWLLYVAAVGTGVSEVFYDTAAQSIVVSLVPRSRLDRANGRLYAVELGAQEFAGPPIAGALAAVALALSFATSAALWIVALAALLALRGTFSPRRVGPRTTIRSDVREGLSFLVDRPVLRTMALMVGMTNFATSAVGAVLVLFFVGSDSAVGLSEPQFGLLFAVLAGGGLIGGVVAERIQQRIGRARALTVSVFGMIAYVSVPALTTNVGIIAAVLFAGGLTTMLWNITTVSFRQRVTPDHLLGRVNSTYRLVAWGTRPLGAILGGALGEWFGVRSVFVVMALVTVAVLIPNRRITEQALTDAEPIEHPLATG